MPAVKRLHQASENNTKPEFIMGHSVQVVSVLVSAADSFLTVPLSGGIHEGVKFSNRDHRTLPQKFCTLADSLGIAEPFVMIADAYYACAAVANWALARGCALISRLRRNAVAFEPFARPIGPRRRGRPRLYGRKIKLRALFDASTDLWQEVQSPVYGERGVTVRLLSRDLLWRPLRRVVRFVLVDHPSRGRCIFFSTDLTLSAVDIISCYGLHCCARFSSCRASRSDSCRRREPAAPALEGQLDLKRHAIHAPSARTLSRR
jgi:DDE superfamily endonuclease